MLKNAVLLLLKFLYLRVALISFATWHKLSILLLFISFHSLAFGQWKFARNYLRIFTDSSAHGETKFLTYPTLAFSPETSWEFGLSNLLLFHAKKNELNRLNEISFFGFVTLENQFGLWSDHAIYTDEEKNFFLGEFKIQNFPLYYHGIGFNTPSEYTALVNSFQVIAKERILKKVHKNLFAGLELEYQRFGNVLFQPANEIPAFALPNGYQGGNTFGKGIGLVHDNRYNVLNVRKGWFSELAVLNYHTNFLSEFSFWKIYTDHRLFLPVRNNGVLAFQLQGQFNSGDVPFNQLALLGGERLMRGYYLGRFRDNNLMATQIEFRQLPIPFSFTNRIGFAGFVAMGNVFPDFNGLRLNQSLWAAGGGLRFLIFPSKDIYTRLEVGFTEEGRGFYFFIGEAF